MNFESNSICLLGFVIAALLFIFMLQEFWMSNFSFTGY